MGSRGVHSSGSGWGPVGGSSEQCNETMGYMKGVKFLD